MNIEETFVPQNIKETIVELNAMIKEAEALDKEITEWYHGALVDIDSRLDVEDELFDVTNMLFVKGIEFNAIMEGLSMIQIYKEMDSKYDII